MSVTVLIPAYRAEDYIAQTVRSVLEQTFTDLTLVVAVDPPADGSPDLTASALAPFVDDPRLRVLHNRTRLGWAENCSSLVQHVHTEFYAFLPHDDVWAPTYVETLHDALRDRPDASVAYTDTIRFQRSPPIRVGMPLTPGASRHQQLFDFLIQGTEAQAWRGLTRASTLSLTHGFPTDDHKGFVVECEYALALHLAGYVVHVPQVLYFKRVHAPAAISASRERLVAEVDERRRAWEVHSKRMHTMLEQGLVALAVPTDEIALFRGALCAAVLRRYQQFVEGTLRPEHLQMLQEALDDTRAVDSPLGAKVQANLHLALHGHHQAAGDTQAAREHAQAAWTVDPGSADAQLRRAKYLMDEERFHEALVYATEAQRLSYLRDGAHAWRLIQAIYRRLGWTNAGASRQGT